MGKARIEIVHPEGSVRIGMVYQTNDAPGFLRLTFGKGSDFDAGLACELGFDAVSRLVSFLGGKTKSLSEDGKPLDLGGGVQFATMRKGEGVVIAAMRKSGDKADQHQITLDAHESYALDLALRQAVFFLAFIRGVNP